MRHCEVPPSGRVVRSSWTLKAPLDHHFWPGNTYADCEFCGIEATTRGATVDPWLDAKRRHPSNTPANVARWDQVAAREREESAAGGRALTFVVVVLARVLFLALAVAGVAADVPVAISVLCGLLMLALLPVVLPRKAARKP